MRVIKTLEDIRRLRRDGKTDQLLLAYLENAFHGLHQALELCDPETFSLEPYGPLVILESQDNLHDLRELGLGPAHGGLFGAIPEFVAQMSIGGRVVYRIYLMSDNDYMTIILVDKDLDKGLEEWVSGYLLDEDNEEISAAALEKPPF